LKFLGNLWVGRACAGANEVELTKVPKSWGRGGKTGEAGWKHGEAKTTKWDPCTVDGLQTKSRPLVGDWRATRDSAAWTGRRPVIARWPQACPTIASLFSNLLIFFCFKKKILLEVLRNFQAFWENGCTVHPFFKASPYTWKCQSFHFSYSLEILFFLKFHFS
jgi:hypothetical protein